MKDLYDNIGVNMLMEPADQAHTAWTTDWLDLQGFEGGVVSVFIGALTGVDGSNYLTLALEEGDDTTAAGATAVAAADIEGAFTVVNSTAKDSVVQSIGYTGAKRYIRVAGTYTGTGITAGVIGVAGIVGRAHKNPVTAPTADAAT